MILTVTFNPAVDHTIRLDEELTDERVSRTNDSKFSAGGNGINVAEYLTALGVDAEATGPVGGFTGEFLKETLTEEAVETDFVENDGLTRMNETILADGEEWKINQKGPELGDRVVEKIIAKIRENDPEYVLVAGSLPPGLEPGDVDRIAASFDGKVVADLHGEVLRELEEEYFFCKPNRSELGESVERDIETLEDAKKAAEEMRKDLSFMKVFASLSGNGVVLSTPEKTLHAETLPVEIVDTVGAGDAFVSGALMAYSRGLSDEGVLRHGIAVSREVVSVKGTSMPEFGDIENHAEQVEITEL
jgi:1-phosphofructokinase